MLLTFRIILVEFVYFNFSDDSIFKIILNFNLTLEIHTHNIRHCSSFHPPPRSPVTLLSLLVPFLSSNISLLSSYHTPFLSLPHPLGFVSFLSFMVPFLSFRKKDILTRKQGVVGWALTKVPFVASLYFHDLHTQGDVYEFIICIIHILKCRVHMWGNRCVCCSKLGLFCFV